MAAELLLWCLGELVEEDLAVSDLEGNLSMDFDREGEEDIDGVVPVELVDTTLLAEDDLCDVKRALLPSVARWKEVGLALRLKPGDLDAIETSPHSTNNDRCLSEMLILWLRGNYSVDRFGEPTWQMLVKAVLDPVGGANPALASSIAEQHRKNSTSISATNTPRYSSSDSLESIPETAGNVAVLALQRYISDSEITIEARVDLNNLWQMMANAKDSELRSTGWIVNCTTETATFYVFNRKDWVLNSFFAYFAHPALIVDAQPGESIRVQGGGWIRPDEHMVVYKDNTGTGYNIEKNHLHFWIGMAMIRKEPSIEQFRRDIICQAGRQQ